MKNEKSVNFFFMIYLIIALINEISNLKCGADQLSIKVGKIDSTETGNKNQGDDYEEISPLKIYVDYTSLQKPSSMSEDSFAHAKRLIDETVQEFEKFLGIHHQNIILTGRESIIKESCNVKEIGSDYGNYLINNDVIVFPSFIDNMGNSVLASAGYCLISTTNSRPIAGILYINSNISFNKKNTDLYIKYLLLHEITHILVFNPSLFYRLGMSTTTTIVNNNTITLINSPKVLEKAREHFGCNSLEGVPLENQGLAGSAGSHWEARYMLGDYMISTDYLDNVISDISLALFEDSGYYKVKYYSGDLFKFGKNKGCDFIKNKCIVNGTPSFEEFCVSPDQPLCSPSRITKGECKIYRFDSIPEEYQYFSDPKIGGFSVADYCPISYRSTDNNDYYPTSCHSGTPRYSEYGERIGNNSFCFISSLIPTYNLDLNITTHAICYRTGCKKNTKQVTVYIGSSSVDCPINGGNVTFSGFKGRIICPKYSDLCDTSSTPLCNEMFNCLSNKVKKGEESYDNNENEDKNESFTIARPLSSSNYIKLSFYNTLILLILFYI